MNGLDWLILGILLFSVLHAAAQGFAFEVFALLGTIVGYLLAAWEYRVAARYLLPYVKTEMVANAAGFLLIFVGVVIFAGVAGRIARWAATTAGLRVIDRLLGAVFGLLRGTLIVVVLVMGLASFLPSSRALTESALAQYFLVAGRGVVHGAPDEFKQKFRDGLKILDREQDSPGPANKRKGEILSGVRLKLREQLAAQGNRTGKRNLFLIKAPVFINHFQRGPQRARSCVLGLTGPFFMAEREARHEGPA